MRGLSFLSILQQIRSYTQSNELNVFQVPPVGNGRCDPDFDIPKYGWDGGDCCASTCISSDDYHCGEDDTGLVEIGYPMCHQPRNDWQANKRPFDNFETESRHSLALSHDGNILARGEPNADRVVLYDADGAQWLQRDRSIDGPLGSNFGESISMSKGLIGTVKNHWTVSPMCCGQRSLGRKRFREGIRMPEPRMSTDRRRTNNFSDWKGFSDFKLLVRRWAHVGIWRI